MFYNLVITLSNSMFSENQNSILEKYKRKLNLFVYIDFFVGIQLN